MRNLLTVALACVLGLAPLAAGAEDDNWTEKVEQSLDKPLGAVNWKNAALPDVLSTIGKAAGVAVVLDHQAVKDAAKIRITLEVPGGGAMTLRAALGNVLKLAGLRYTLKDQAIFVSTREKIVGELLIGVRGPAPAVPGVSYPMTPGDAVAATVDFYDGREERLPETIADLTRAPVDARFETPPYRDSLGRLHFPGPPLYLQGRDVLDPYLRFSSHPWFLRPPYLAPYYWGPASSSASASEARQTEALRALLDYMRRHPDITVGQLIQQLEAGMLKPEKKK
jgi:hypothetical protein